MVVTFWQTTTYLLILLLFCKACRALRTSSGRCLFQSKRGVQYLRWNNYCFYKFYKTIKMNRMTYSGLVQPAIAKLVLSLATHHTHKLLQNNIHTHEAHGDVFFFKIDGSTVHLKKNCCTSWRTAHEGHMWHHRLIQLQRIICLWRYPEV